jgi:hypothetical protein
MYKRESASNIKIVIENFSNWIMSKQAGRQEGEREEWRDDDES